MSSRVPSRPVPSRPVPSRPVPSRPVPSRPVPSRPVPSRPVPSRPVPSRPVPSRPVPSRPVPSRPVPSRHSSLVLHHHNSLQTSLTVTRVVHHIVDGSRQRVEVLHDDDALVVGVRRDALQLRHADAGADAENDDVDAGLAGGQGLGERLRRVVRLAVGEDDDDVGVARSGRRGRRGTSACGWCGWRPPCWSCRPCSAG